MDAARIFAARRLARPHFRLVDCHSTSLFEDTGLQRSVVVLRSSGINTQFRRLAKDSGVFRFERYINAAEDPDWLEHALAWPESQADPDPNPVAGFQR
jgi:hypothetical protein